MDEFDYIVQAESNQTDDEYLISSGEQDIIDPEVNDVYILVHFKLNSGTVNTYSDSRVTSDMIVEDWRASDNSSISNLTVSTGNGTITVTGTVNADCYIALMLKGQTTNDAFNSDITPTMMTVTQIQQGQSVQQIDILNLVAYNITRKYTYCGLSVVGYIQTNSPCVAIDFTEYVEYLHQIQPSNTEVHPMALAYIDSVNTLKAAENALTTSYTKEDNILKIYDADELNEGSQVKIYLGILDFDPTVQNDSTYVEQDASNTVDEVGDD